SVEEQPLYDALSYTLGDPRPAGGHARDLESLPTGQAGHIICNGRSLPVTSNLERALSVLRESGSGRYNLQKRIWIDALCINQEDLSERSAQVNIMDRIYKGASSVVAWLGESQKNTPLALQTIRLIARIPEDRYDHYRKLDLAQLRLPDAALYALVGLLRRAWFTRVWVIQEASLARRLLMLWGSYEIPYPEFVRTACFLTEGHLWLKLTAFAAMYQSDEDRALQRPIKPIGAVLSAFLPMLKASLAEGTMHPVFLMVYGRACEATDPRDLVYGVFGFVKEAVKTFPGDECNDLQLPQPDYTKSVSQVFFDFAQTFVKSGGHGFLLSYVEDRSYRSKAFVDALPSWIPDLSVTLMPMTLMTGTSQRKWCPSGEETLERGIVTMNGHLRLRGAMVDRITAVAELFDDVGDNHNNHSWIINEYSDSWISMLDLVKPLTLNTVSGTTFAEALWRTLIADGVPWDRGAISAPADMAQAFSFWIIRKL
ncbi:MAG: hypothetical protein Q9218_008005, partial [Villophora microphyllina]